jgi:hypothetical protein
VTFFLDRSGPRGDAWFTAPEWIRFAGCNTGAAPNSYAGSARPARTSARLRHALRHTVVNDPKACRAPEVPPYRSPARLSGGVIREGSPSSCAARRTGSPWQSPRRHLAGHRPAVQSKASRSRLGKQAWPTEGTRERSGSLVPEVLLPRPGSSTRAMLPNQASSSASNASSDRYVVRIEAVASNSKGTHVPNSACL